LYITQVTRSVDTASGQLSSQEQKTVDAIVKARYRCPSLPCFKILSLK
jgi:hypothetical protein